MIQYSEEEKIWELSEKLLVQMVGSDKTSKYKNTELIKYCYAVASEFNAHKSLALEKSKQENKNDNNNG